MTNSTNNRAHDNIRPSIGVSVAKSGQLKQYDFNASAPVQMNCRFNLASHGHEAPVQAPHQQVRAPRD